MLRLGSHGAFSDQRITFDAALLKKGTNQITLNMRKGGYGYSAMYDYVRLECNLNQPPVVNITTPVRDTTFTAPADILLVATASDPNGNISQVDFYNGNTLLGTAASSPYRFDWTNIAAGTYLITAKATNNNGTIATDTITIQVNPPTDCWGTPYGTATLDNCGQCVGGNTGQSACTDSLQAETACSVDGIQSENVNAGYSGDGYVNTTNAIGSSASWILNSTSGQTATLSFRYANGGTTSRNGNVSVNGTQVATLAMPSTGSWTDWKLATVNIPLSQGYNELKITATTADGLANLDIIYISDGVSHASCLVTGVTQKEMIDSLFTPIRLRELFTFLRKRLGNYWIILARY
jgi:hypothetical protein